MGANKLDNAVIDDPWVVLDPPVTGKSWKEKTGSERFVTVMLYTLKVSFLLGFLYLFICSLDFLSNAFRLLGGKAAGQAFTNSVILSNPIAGLMIGVLATVLLQSSSTTTSIVVSMVAADFLAVRPAIFMVMGANIGTSVTNTIVALGQSLDRNEFRRAFAGATVHDMFNWLAVICLLPIEWLSGAVGPWSESTMGSTSVNETGQCGVLCQFTGWIVHGLKPEQNKAAKKDMLKVITKPFTSLIIQVDKNIVTAVAKGDPTAMNKSLIKHYCSVNKMVPIPVFNSTTGQCGIGWEEQTVKERCVFMFEHVSNYWTDEAIGVCLLVIALVTLCCCLVCIVKLLHSLLRGKMAVVIKRFVNADFPGCARHLTGYVAILIGAGLTMLVQSSSIFTSAITPLVGVGVLNLDRMYPLTLGANIGTTFTAILAALASDSDKLYITLQVALCHLFFNIFGILIWYPVPHCRRIPVAMAKTLGNTVAKYRWFAFVYLIVIFFMLPGAIFGLSMAGWKVLMGVGIPFLIFVICIVIINVMQQKHPDRLPAKLRTWDCLPEALHSLDPLDRVLTKIGAGCSRKCKCLKDPEKQSDEQDPHDIDIHVDTHSTTTTDLQPTKEHEAAACNGGPQQNMGISNGSFTQM